MRRVLFIEIAIFLLACHTSFCFDESQIENDDGIYVETMASSDIPNVNARSAMLYDATYGKVLFEKNSKQKRPNASTTKMLTALVAIENGNLEDIIEVSNISANTAGSTIHLKEGDKITLDGLIKGLLICSGNDAAVAIAEYIAGDIDSFSSLMNEKAREIGALDTNFVTPHGLDAENHYTTASDLILIAQELLANKYLADIVSHEEITIHINGKEKILRTTNEMFSVYDGINGVKTGYTGKAGRCIVTSAKKNQRQLICVVLGCDSKKNRTIDTIRLLDYGFEKYQVEDLSKYGNEEILFLVEKSKEEMYKIIPNINVFYPLKEEEKRRINVKYELKSNLRAPLKKGDSIGQIVYYLGDEAIRRIECKLSEDIPQKVWKEYFKYILESSYEKYENMVEKMWKI